VTTYSEKTLTSLLDGANDADGDAISVYRLDGAVPSSWPHSVALTEGSALVAQDGTITFDDGGDTSAHPSSGSQANGSFSFTLWDGMDESAPYTASVALEATGVETFAPARPSAVIISAPTSDSFDVTLPADPDDGGDPITKRVVSLMPEADFNAGNFSNASYLNNFSQGETRNIDGSDYPGISASQTHAVRWKAINMSPDNGGSGPYSTPEIATLVDPANAPQFTTQPSFDTGSYNVGGTVTLSLGGGTGDNSVTASVEYFRLGTVSKTGELSGLTWNSSGESSGVLYLKTRLTDDVTGASTLSNEVTASLTLVSSGNVKQALTDLVNTVGRQNRPVTPVTAITLPSGVSIDGSQPIVRITGNNVNMSNVDFTGFRVSVTGDNGTLFHNKFGSESGPIIVNQNYMLDLQAGATGWDIYENDFVGFPGYSGGGTDNRLDEAACIWQSPTASGPSVIRRNLMYWFKNDGLKPTNLSACSENVILPPWQLDGLETYSSTKSYNTGDQVLEQSGYGRVFIALQGSQGKSLPSGGALATNTWWKGYDPHTDLYNPRVNLNQYTFYRNVLYRQADHPSIPQALRPQGAINIVNSGRILRNTNSSATFVKLILEECASIGQAVHGSQMPFTADDGGQGNWTSVNMINCYIDADNGGYRNGGGWGNFTGNVDYTTDAAIS